MLPHLAVEAQGSKIVSKALAQVQALSLRDKPIQGVIVDLHMLCYYPTPVAGRLHTSL
jgi:hypothetical protein